MDYKIFRDCFNQLKPREVVRGYYSDGRLKYEGEVDNRGNPSGLGRWYFENGDRYDGQWKGGDQSGYGWYFRADGSLMYKGDFKYGQPCGQGTWYFTDGGRYEGESKDGERSGWGRSYRADGSLWYEGSYRNSERHGQGKEYDEKGRLIYDGEWKAGEYCGQGRFCFKNGDCYEGEFKDGKYCGQGRYYLADGRLLYEGEWRSGKRHGQGKEYLKDGSRYEGEFKDDKWNGRGRYYRADGSLMHEGFYLDSNWHGRGKLYFEDGSRYEGEFKDDKQSGQGRHYRADGSLLYDGTYLNGKRNGRGRFYAENGSHYEGAFKDDEFCGYGQYYRANGKLLYEGMWKDDQFCSQGTEYLEDGSRYEGEFEDGKWNGQGRYYRADDSLLYEGEWKDGKRHGQGKLYREDGTLAYEGEFKDGEPTGPYSRNSSVRVTRPEGGEDLDACLKELDGLIGLDAVKRQVNSLISTVKTRNERKRRGLVVPDMSYHMVFTGNPGTGKTTVARLIGRIYANLGVVSKGHLIETDRAGLVAGYVGQTALKTEAVVNEAIGGILFIDEAYSLIKKDTAEDYGKEAIEYLLKRMEDDRADFVVIAAGYDAPMEQDFLSANEGLRSRFKKVIHFDDYGLPDLLKLLEFNCEKGGYHLGAGVRELFTRLLKERMKDEAFMKTFSNGRYVRNIFESMMTAQAERLEREIADLSTVSDQVLTELTVKDLQHIVDTGEFSRLA